MRNPYWVLIFCLCLLVGCEQTVDEKIDDNQLDGIDEQHQITNEEDEQIDEGVQGVKEDDDERVENVETEEVEELNYYRVNEENWSIEPIDEGNEQVVLLTIDDAPDKHSLEMAETLHTLGVNAIFFVNGHLLNEEGKVVIERLHKMGFEIGNHTMNHPNMSELSEEEQRFEIIELNDMLYEITGEYPRFYRAPFGVNTDVSNELMEELEMTRMNWTYGYDWETDYLDPEPLADIMVNAPELQNGANLLMHDRQWTADALEKIVHGLQAKGYEVVDPKLIKVE
ncbi:polysaccharide deacetylase family protein [Halalkalibacter hemicellulosilyticus]|uniref:Polysaccharide deacetylase n=1 Tax=Halalkalibacter hemicellulosilyticusJCM 9152 TaxID=1236971 RepID=W4QD15_9BACI|nr:polysaccharide deacetylase family protein [Halalkalibacter hemicellulosilyticus]GAE29915.1 polysaccharide deacetylase [Halalkalibacter hemicellulosilyticusJCM 9152]